MLHNSNSEKMEEGQFSGKIRRGACVRGLELYEQHFCRGLTLVRIAFGEMMRNNGHCAVLHHPK